MKQLLLRRPHRLHAGFRPLRHRYSGHRQSASAPAHRQGSISSRQFERSTATLLDVDTPADAAVLKRHPACPPELRSLDTWDGELGARIDALMRLVTTPEKELIVAGRVGAPVWSYLESQTACRVRMLAEERGMQAAGRDAPAKRAPRSASSTARSDRRRSSRASASSATGCSSTRECCSRISAGSRPRTIVSRRISSAPTLSRTASCARSPRPRAPHHFLCCSADRRSSPASSGRLSRRRGPGHPEP